MTVKKKSTSKKKVNLGEKATFKKQLLRFGKWIHKKAPDGVLNITKDFCQKLVDNYKLSPFAPITRGHVESEELEKNPTLILNKNISGLEMDEKGLNAVMELDKEELDKYNDVSVSLDLNGEDHTTGKGIGPVLKHVALVTNPYIKGLEAFMPLHEVKDNLLINLSEITEMEETKTEPEVKEEEVKEVPAEEPKTEESDTETPEKTPEVKPEAEESKEEPKEEAKLAEADGLQKKIVELEEKIAKQETLIATREAEAGYAKFLKAGKITPAQKDIYINLCTQATSTIELSDGSKTDVKTLVNDLFDKAPKLIEFEEKGVDVETAEKDSKLKTELREAHRKDMSDKEFERWWDKHGETAKVYANAKH